MLIRRPRLLPPVLRPCCALLLAGAGLGASAQAPADTPTPAPTTAADGGSAPAAIQGPGLLTPVQACRVQQRARIQARPWRLSPPTDLVEQADAPALLLEADQLGGAVGQNLVAQGQVRLQRGTLALATERLRYHYADDRAQAEGGVELWRGEDHFSGREIELGTRDAEGWVIEPRFRFGRSQAGGGAERIDFLGRDRMVVLGATYSSCDPEPDQTLPWELSARRLNLDFAANEGIADGAVLRFYDVPILAWPALSFPVTDARKSGWLPPHITVASTSGLEVGAPYYWNIAPQADATITPYVSTRRGASVDGEFRYLLPEHGGGELHGALLPNDRVSQSSRWAFGWRQDSQLAPGWDVDWSLLRVSDNDYWKDGLRGADSLTPRLLGSQAQLRNRRGLQSDWFGDVDQWLYARVQHWQVLQSTIASDAIVAPYQREPQLGALWRSQRGGLSASLQAEANQFTRVQDGKLTGSRAHLLGDLAWQLGDGGWQLTPRLGLNAAAYETTQAMSDGRFHAARTIPTFSLESAWSFDRDTRLFQRDLVQTLEPRLLYVRTPWRDLSRLPNFDSARLDLNAHSLFSPNAFSGVDWVSEAEQVTAGLTSRFLATDSGAELASLGVAQRFVLRDQQAAPDALQTGKGYSDLYLLGSLNSLQAWRFDSAIQYDPDSQRVQRSINQINYHPGPFRTLNLSYRLQRGASEQIALGWQWPLRGTLSTPAAEAVAASRDAAPAARAGSNSCQGALYGVGRLDYSLSERRVSGAILGLEYDAGCWIGRVVAARQSTGASAATTRLMLQLELVGLSRLGSNPLGVLKDNIPGYTLLRDPRADAGQPALPAAPLP